MKWTKGMATLAATVLAAGTVTFVGAGSAEAASSCPGKRIKRVSYDTGWTDLYSSKNYNCVITHNRKPGVKYHMGAYLTVVGGTKKQDYGYYTKHAGPVKLYTKGACVNFGGKVGNTGDDGKYHCGK
ncbi:hypothetical protein [Streptomyces sp. NPDC059788]|uniref:hypothetical protein n=1 Tax=Streptomyces sp. NPDC059788 TaxID=3346948 RepID=UPI003651C45C